MRRNVVNSSLLLPRNSPTEVPDQLRDLPLNVRDVIRRCRSGRTNCAEFFFSLHRFSAKEQPIGIPGMSSEVSSHFIFSISGGDCPQFRRN